MNPQTLRVTGMTCGHCARTIANAVGELPDIQQARVDLKTHTLTYDGKASREDVIAAIRDAGYDAQES